MSGPSEPDRTTPEQSISIEERIDLLFDELSFAIQWQRPSILLVFYDSESVREMVELSLQHRLVEIGQKLVHFKVDQDHYDIPRLLSLRPDRKRSVYSIIAPSQGGGKNGANAYRALNMRREYFVDHALRMILWLAGDESVELSRHAPDFWAFRHRVLEFHELLPVAAPQADDPGTPVQSADLHEQILKLETAIASLPKKVGNHPQRLKLLVQLASLLQASQAYAQALRCLKQGLALAKLHEDALHIAEVYASLGSVYLEMERFNSSVRAYRKASHCSPRDAGLWIRLGHVYRKEQRLSDAIIAYKQAWRLDPQNPSANSSLVACYRLLGKDTLAEQQSKIALPVIRHAAEYDQAAFEAACGHTTRAVALLASALEHKQVSLNAVQHEPNFDSIRNDPEFQRLIGVAPGQPAST